MSTSLELLTPEDRRNRIREGLEDIKPLIIAAYQACDWEHFGYQSWTDYLAGEFGGPLRLAKPERNELIGELRKEGLSYRAIGEAVGVSPETARSGVQNWTPDIVVGLDGKQYQPTRPQPVLTEEQQREQDIKDADRRAINRLEQAVNGYIEIESLPTHPRRQQLLDQLTDHDRKIVLYMEERLT